MTHTGKLVVLEGLDGSGKTVQLKLLQERLINMGLTVAIADFPDYNTFYGRLVGRYLNGEFGDVLEVNPYLSSLLYAENRKEAASNLWNWLEDGRVLLVNRYASANMAYHSVKLPAEQRAAFIAWVKELEYSSLVPIPREDLVIFFNSDVSVAQEMVDRKDVRDYTEKRRDIHERNTTYLKEVAQAYLGLCSTESHWVRLDVIDPATRTMYPPEHIHDRVIDLLKERKIIL
jgi:dTMP kinase